MCIRDRGSTDVDMLREMAKRLQHPVAAVWDERINTFYVQNNYPDKSLSSEIERVDGGFGITPRDHFRGLCQLLPHLRGLAILDNDGRARTGSVEGQLQMVYWRRYEAENYFVTPDVLRRYALGQFEQMDLFGGFQREIDEVLNALVLEDAVSYTHLDVYKRQLVRRAPRLIGQ